jgi:hypothetical protein
VVTDCLSTKTITAWCATCRADQPFEQQDRGAGLAGRGLTLRAA